MRHLLDFLHLGKRDAKNEANADDERSDRPDPASTLIIAGEPVPRTQASPDSDQLSKNDAADESKSQRLVDVIKSKHRDRWHPPELEGPEFGGLIERRGVDTRGLMPKKFKANPEEEHRQQSAPEQATDPSRVAASAGAKEEEVLESTGKFIASLDNSAITLADSGLFKVSEEDEDEPAPDGSINPYDHKG